MDEQNGFASSRLEMDFAEGDSKTSLQPTSKKNGIFLTYPLLVICVLGAVALSTIVGLIVHFAHPEKICVCPDPEIPTSPATTPSIPATTTTPPISEDYIWELCINVSLARNECIPCNVPTEPPITTTPSPVGVNYRLPDTLEPLHYNVEIRPDIYGTETANFNFEGHVEIQLKCKQATNYIIVHKRNIDVTEGTVSVTNLGNLQPIQVSDTSFEEETEFFRITLARTLNVDEEVMVSMDYKGPLLKDMSGLFWTDYMEANQRKFMIGTQFQSTDARKAFPCLDEPNLKATFNITLDHQPPTVALANMPSYETEDLGDGWLRTRFEQTSVRMSTYLIAFAIGDYEMEEGYANGTNALTPKYFRNWAPREDIQNGNAAWATEVTQPIFDYFENLFQFAYPLPKTDQIAIPELGSFAMENWGLVTYRPVRILYNPDYSTTYAKEQVAATIAHELLHMWFGNIVTCNWWGELWLQEGFARYYQHLAENDAVPSWDQDDIFISQVLYGALNADGTGSSYPMTDFTINSPAEVGGMFGTVTYDKGACMLRMLKGIMGEGPFDLSMQDFIAKMAYSSAIEDDLFASLEARYTMTPSLGEVLKTWTNQIGYPVVTFRRTGNPDEVEITQKMYLVDPDAPINDRYPTRYDYTWHIPVSYATENDPNGLEWLNREDRNVTVSGLGDQDWILGNLEHNGFYRVNYDSLGWAALIRKLQDAHTDISPVNRAALIHDAFYLARSGDLDQLTALELLAYLEKEEGYLPFFTMATTTPYVDGMIYDYPDYVNFRTFVRRLIQPTCTRLGWQEDPADSLGTLYLRSLVLEWACEYDMEDCITQAHTYFNNWKQNPTDMTIIHPDNRAAVYCTAARESSDNWEWLLDRYFMEDDESETAVIRDSLMCSRQPWELQRLFMMAVDGELKARDVNSVLQTIASNKNARAFIWETLNSMWNDLPRREAILSNVIEYFSTQEEYDQILEFTSRNADDLSGQTDDLLRGIRANMKWQERNREDITTWLQTVA